MSQDDIMKILCKHPRGLIEPELKRKMNVKWIDTAQIISLVKKRMILRVPVITEGTNTWLLIPLQKPEEKMIIWAE